METLAHRWPICSSAMYPLLEVVFLVRAALLWSTWTACQDKPRLQSKMPRHHLFVGSHLKSQGETHVLFTLDEMRRQNSNGFHFSQERAPQNPFSTYTTRRAESFTNLSAPRLPAQVIEPSTLARFNIGIPVITIKEDTPARVDSSNSFQCPICNNSFSFNDERSINQHIDLCLNTSSGILDQQPIMSQPESDTQ